MVSISCLKEINRLRAAYRLDLKPYILPTPPEAGRKRKLAGSAQYNEPKPKKPRHANTGSANKGKQPIGTSETAAPKKTPRKRKRTEVAKPVDEQPAKKARGANKGDVECLYQGSYKFHLVDEQWQRNMCNFMGLRFCRPNKVSRGGPDVPIGPPDPCAIKPIGGDGNCFFHSLSYIITGSKLQHIDVRRVIVDHMKFVDYYPPG